MRKSKISVVNYGMGNIYSISNAIRSLGFQAEIITAPDEVAASEFVVLPGVGAFGDAMRNLRDSNMDSAITDYAGSGRPLLGICLGMQLLYESSEENVGVKGLSLMRGAVKRFPSKAEYKIPQIQWNQIAPSRESRIFQNLDTAEYYYFLHSYYVEPLSHSNLASTTNYCDIEYCCAIEDGNIFGVQFHPEKSGAAGLQLLRNIFG